MTPPLLPKLVYLNKTSSLYRLIELIWQSSPRWLLLMLGVTITTSVMPVALLYVNKLIIDWITTHAGKMPIVWMPLLVLIGIRLLLSTIRVGLAEVGPLVSQALSERLSLTATRQLLQKAIELDLNHFESPSFYDLLGRATQSGSSYPVRALEYLTASIGQLISFSGLIVLLAQFSPVILFLLLMTFIPMLKKGVAFSKKRFMLNRKNTFEGRLTAYFQGLLTQREHAKEIRLLNLGGYILTQWQNTYNQYRQEIERMTAKQALGSLQVALIPHLSFYGAYVWIIVQTVQGEITLGDFVMYSGAFSQAQSLLIGCAQSLANTYDAILYVSQFFEFLALQPKITNPAVPQPFPHSIHQGIELKNVGFSYACADQPIFTGLSFKVHPGESIAVVGVNGAGKTTLVKLLTRLYEVNAGEITIDGIPISAFDVSELRRNIAVLFQDFSHYKLSIQDNIGFGDIDYREDQRRSQIAAEKAGIAEFIETLEKGYQTNLDNLFPDGRELSGGQWQKVGLSRAFISRAQILILDEPTSAMDAIAEFNLYQRFRQLTEGKTTFFISHRFSSVRLADRILVLDKGCVAELGTHEQLLQNQGLYAQMFNLQASGYAPIDEM